MAILKNKKKNILITGVIVLPILLSTSAAAAKPLHQVDNTEPPVTTAPTTLPDSSVIITTDDGQTLTIIGEGAQALADEINPPAPTPEPAPVVAVSNATFAQQNVAPVSAPPSAVGNTLLEAARSQIGQAQDCTSMVERALRAIGIDVGDVGPMGFAGIGIQISPADAQPGDIMMRGGHVAIYAGNGSAVHGGFGGSTVESSSDSNPYSYALIVRV